MSRINKQIKYLFIVILIFICKPIFSQENVIDKDKIIENFIERINMSTDQEYDYTILVEDLNYFWENPLNLNTASKEDLEKLRLLSDYQIQSIQSYIKEYGKINTIYELQLINGFTPDIIENILPFVTVLPDEAQLSYSPKKALLYGKHEVFLRGQQIIEKQKGYTSISDSALAKSPNSRYLGSPQKLYAKYQYNYKNKVSWGITASKDAGEEFFKGSNKKGFDFYSAHLFIKDLKFVRKVALGDYHVAFGQGLIICSNWISGKSSYVLSIGDIGQGLAKYASTGSGIFFRGAGSTVRIKDIDITAFYSQKKTDANLKKVDTLIEESRDEFETTSVLVGTLHTTPSELENRNKLEEKVMGGNISFSKNFYHIGASFVHYEFTPGLAKSTRIYNKYDFYGNKNTDYSIDYKFILKNINFFGEAAMSENNGKAFVNGMVITPVSAISFSMLHRYYSPDYQAYYGNSFSVSGNQNEKGFFIGTEFSPYKRWSISAYYDVYAFPWIKSSASSPSKGLDYFAQTTYTPSHRVEMYFRIRHQLKEENNSAEVSPIKVIGNVESTRLRYNLTISASDELQLKNRIEYIYYKETGKVSEKGFLIYQDINYSPEKLPFSASLRYGIFDTDTYNASIYAFESDVLYSMSTPAYYSKGTRFYLLLKYNIRKGIDIWLRYAQTYYSNKQVISSGLSEIQGNTKSEIKAMVRFQF